MVLSLGGGSVGGSGGTCFLPGALIRAAVGEAPVETLKRGDSVITQSGARKPIVWIGRGEILVPYRRRNYSAPVIIRKGAFSDGVPYQDLHVTAGHSFYFSGILIPAEFLVNHRSIVWDDRAQEIEVFHVELEDHDVLVANGAAAESYRDDGNRWLFRNANAGWELPAKAACAPVVTGGAQVDAVWRALLVRSGERLNLPMGSDPDLHLLVDGRRMEGRAVREGVWSFALSGAERSIVIASRAGAPDELGLSRDPRRLGVAIKQMVLWTGSTPLVIEADDPALRAGFHGYEPDLGCLWTDGAAVLPPDLVSKISGVSELHIQVGHTAQYPYPMERRTQAG